MHKASLIVFANFKIDNKERYQRMQDSFLSFKNLSVKKWVINIRGAYRDEAFIFLENHLGKKLNSYRLNSKKGWFHDTRLMLNDIDTNFVFFWIEDHINMLRRRKILMPLMKMWTKTCISTLATSRDLMPIS